MRKRAEIKNFIGMFDNYLEPKVSDKLIEYFEANTHKSYDRISTDGSTKNFKDDLSLTFYKTDLWIDENDMVCKALRECINVYLKTTAFLEYTGCKDLHFTHMKMQRTKPTGGYHLWHIERNYSEACRRALVYTVYLNDINDGGETEFLFQKIRVKPKKGRVAIFPADFPYVHRGNPPLKKDKYILTSWFNF